MKIILSTILLFILGCNSIDSKDNSFSHNNNLNQLIDSYVFLSENHDLLHIMMGEHEGSPIDSYLEYKNKIDLFKNNLYLKPVLLGLHNIQVVNNDSLVNADKFDALVDYYQMGIQMMIDGILKGIGYNGKMPQNSEEYKLIKIKIDDSDQ